MTARFIRLTSGETGQVHIFNVDSIELCSPLDKVDFAHEGEPGHKDHPARSIVVTERATLHVRETVEEIAVKMGELEIEVV